MALLDPPDVVTEDGNPSYTKDPPANADPVRFRPWDIYDSVACTAMQWRAEEWVARARRALLAHQSMYIEQELWTGFVAQAAGFPNDYLLNTPTIVGGGALGYARALAELEQAAADVANGQPAMIHAQPRVVSLWVQNGLVSPNASGRQLRTAFGTIVVPGTGYPGTGTTIAPGASTVAEAYAYITGLVSIRLGPIRELRLEGAGTTAEADFDPDVNDFVVRVERPVVYWFDPCLKHGVLINLTQAH